MNSSLKKYIDITATGENLSKEDSRGCLNTIFTGNCKSDEIIKLLLNLKDKGESVEEMAGFASAMREKMLKVPVSKKAIDLCGTGGTGKERFNVSTAASFILSAASVPVAKHGNYGSKKGNGSFDFLKSLDISFDLTVSELQSIFEETDLCFLFARNHHQAMKYVAEARKQINARTIFNILGPLCNPASVDYQVIGAVNEDIAQKIAHTIKLLGTSRSLVIAGADGLDELSTTGKSIIYEINSDSLERKEFDPLTLGLKAVPADIKGAGAKDNAGLFCELFSNNRTDHKISELVCLNAGAAFYCFGKVKDIQSGYKLAEEQIISGAAWNKYLLYKEASKK
ncbi:MAG: anthranilate phosphoribosyltransferase [bacterium]|nr:anthranilate phosphoribosyltransferase [bacterium]